MSNPVIAAIVGAIIGALVTGLIAFWLHRVRTRSLRNWDLALRVSQTLGSILSAYTPDSVKSREDVWELQQEWGIMAREIYILGGGKLGDSITNQVNDYIQTLIAYIDGNMKRGELEHRRTSAKEAVAKLMERYTRL